MTVHPCAICDRPMATDTAYVCRVCTERLGVDLRTVADLAAEFATTIARQGRTGALGGPGGTSRPLPFDWCAADARWAVGNTVVTWAKHVVEARGVPPPALVPVGEPIAVVARWLVGQLDWLRHQPEAPEAYDELADAVRLTIRTIDRHGVRWYAGPCEAKTPDGPCYADLYAAPSAQVVRCSACGAEHDAQARLEWLLDQAQDSLLHAEWMAQVLSKWNLGGIAGVSSARVRGMARHGRIVAHDHDASGRPVYRLGDVVEVIHDQEKREREREALRAAKAARRSAA